MNRLTRTLLGGAALSALAAAPGMAQQKHSAFNLMALHAGRVVNKTGPADGQHRSCSPREVCTYTIYSYIASADFHKMAPLINTFYRWNNSFTLCSPVHDKVKVGRKSIYGKVRAGTVTYSEGCTSGPTTFFGDDYKLTDKSGEGKVDEFISTLSGKFENNGVQYKGKVNLDVHVFIDTK